MAGTYTVNGKTFTVYGRSEKPEPKKTIVVGIKKKSDGGRTGVNLTPESQDDAKTLSKATSETGRLTATQDEAGNTTFYTTSQPKSESSQTSKTSAVTDEVTGRSQADYTNVYTRQQSVDYSMQRSGITRVQDKQGRTVGIYDEVAGESRGFSTPLSKKEEFDLLLEEQRRTENDARNRRQNNRANNRNNNPNNTNTVDSESVPKKKGFFKEEFQSMRKRIKEEFPDYAKETTAAVGKTIKEDTERIGRGSRKIVYSPYFKFKAAAEARKKSFSEDKGFFRSMFSEPYKAKIDYQQTKWHDSERREAAFGAVLLVSGTGAVGTVAKIGGNAVFGAAGAVSVVAAAKNPSPESGARAIVYGAGGLAASRTAVIESFYGLRGIGAAKVSQSAVFSDQVLSGKQRFPTSKSTGEIVSKFEATRQDGYIQGVHASGEPLPRKGKVSQAGRAAEGTEGAGLNVAPLGEGSPEFTGIGASGYKDFSFNPFQKTNQPTASIIKAKDVVFVSEASLQKSGFTAENIFQENLQSKDVFIIGKRELIGQGELKPQKYTNPTTGKTSIEKGTSETQARVPLDAEFVSKDRFFFKQKTSYKEQPVMIRQYELLGDTSPENIAALKKQGFSVKTGKQVLSEVSSSSVYGGKKSVVLGSSRLSTPANVSSLTSAPSSKSTPSSFSSSSIASSSSSSPQSSISSGGSKPSRLSSSLSSSQPYTRGSSPASTPPYSPAGSSSTVIAGGSSSLSSTGSSVAYGGSSYKKFDSVYSPNLTNKNRVRRNRRKDTNTYSTYIRRRGEFKQTGSFTSLNKAFKSAKRTVGTTAAASFKIVDRRSGQTVTGRNTGGDFYLSTKEQGVYIERRSRRIKSGGELQEITFKGVKASKKKKRQKEGVFNL